MEIVANLAVWLGGECHVGQMIDWFGSYDRTSGLSARLLLRKPANEGSERDFQVSAKRRFERLSSSIDTLESGHRHFAATPFHLLLPTWLQSCRGPDTLA